MIADTTNSAFGASLQIWSIRLAKPRGSIGDIVVAVDIVGADLEQHDVWLGAADRTVDDTGNLRDLPTPVSLVMLREGLAIDRAGTVGEGPDERDVLLVRQCLMEDFDAVAAHRSRAAAFGDRIANGHDVAGRTRGRGAVAARGAARAGHSASWRAPRIHAACTCASPALRACGSSPSARAGRSACVRAACVRPPSTSTPALRACGSSECAAASRGEPAGAGRSARWRLLPRSPSRPWHGQRTTWHPRLGTCLRSQS